MSVTIRVNNDVKGFGQHHEGDDSSVYSFTLSKGEYGFEEFASLLGGEFVEVGCNRLTRTASGFVLMEIDFVEHTDDESLGYYKPPVIDEAPETAQAGF